MKIICKVENSNTPGPNRGGKYGNNQQIELKCCKTECARNHHFPDASDRCIGHIKDWFVSEAKFVQCRKLDQKVKDGAKNNTICKPL